MHKRITVPAIFAAFVVFMTGVYKADAAPATSHLTLLNFSRDINKLDSQSQPNLQLIHHHKYRHRYRKRYYRPYRRYRRYKRYRRHYYRRPYYKSRRYHRRHYKRRYRHRYYY